MPTARRLSSHKGWLVDWLRFLIQVILIFHVCTNSPASWWRFQHNSPSGNASSYPPSRRSLRQTFSGIFWTDVFISKQCPTWGFPSPRFPNSSQASLVSCTQLSIPVDHKHSAHLFLIGKSPWPINMKLCFLWKLDHRLLATEHLPLLLLNAEKTWSSATKPSVIFPEEKNEFSIQNDRIISLLYMGAC